jgi:hypothetical protein
MRGERILALALGGYEVACERRLTDACRADDGDDRRAIGDPLDEAREIARSTDEVARRSLPPSGSSGRFRHGWCDHSLEGWRTLGHIVAFEVAETEVTNDQVGCRPLPGHDGTLAAHVP